MTTFLYFVFYAWIIGVVLFAAISFAAIKTLGGRESFTIFFNRMQGTRYEPHHIDWALTLATIFWPQVVATQIFKVKTRHLRREDG